MLFNGIFYFRCIDYTISMWSEKEGGKNMESGKRKKPIIIRILVVMGVIICACGGMALWNNRPRVRDDEIFNPQLTEPGPTITVLTEFPTGAVNEQSMVVEYEAAPGAGAFITEVYYTINGENKSWLYLSSAEEDDPRKELGKGWIQLSLGENNIIFTVKDSMRRSESYEVKEKPILETIWDVPEYGPEDMALSIRREGTSYVVNQLCIIPKIGVEVSREEIEELIQIIDGQIIGSTSSVYYIGVMNSTEDELDEMCELLMTEHKEKIEFAYFIRIGKMHLNSDLS